MPIVSCPECGKKLKLSTTLAPGKRIQCPECSTRFAPDSDDEERPGRGDDRVRSGGAPRERRARDDDGYEERRPRRPRDDDDRETRRRPRDDDDDDRRERRPRSYDDRDDGYDERPRRRGKKKSNKALILWLSIGGGGLLLAGAVVLILLLVLGGSSYDSLMRDGISLLNEMAGILESVKDRDSARAAAPQLERLANRVEAMMKRANDLGQPSPEEQKRLQERYDKDMRKALERVAKAGRNLSPAAASEPAFQAAMTKLQRLRPF